MTTRIVALGLMMIVAGGCTGTLRSMMGQHRDEKAPLVNVKASEDGVCAYVDSSSTRDGVDEIKACARHAKEGGALLFTEFFFNTEDRRLDPATWRLVVKSANTVVLDRRLQPGGRPYKAGCIYGTCHAHTASSEAIANEWTPGRYDLRYTSDVDGTVWNASITLE
jgi:hypothetical protein